MPTRIEAASTTGLVKTTDLAQSSGSSLVSQDGKVVRLGTNSGASDTINPLYIRSAYLGGTASANLLDDYEEGTWTPSMSGGTTAGSLSSTAVEGIYTKVGQFVHCEFRISGGNLTGAAGTANLTGLPFTIGGTGYGCSGSFATHTVDFDPASRPVLQLGSGTQAYFLVSNDDAGWGSLTVGAFDNNPFTLIGTFTYVTSA